MAEIVFFKCKTRHCRCSICFPNYSQKDSCRECGHKIFPKEDTPPSSPKTTQPAVGLDFEVFTPAASSPPSSSTTSSTQKTSSETNGAGGSGFTWGGRGTTVMPGSANIKKNRNSVTSRNTCGVRGCACGRACSPLSWKPNECGVCSHNVTKVYDDPSPSTRATASTPAVSASASTSVSTSVSNSTSTPASSAAAVPETKRGTPKQKKRNSVKRPPRRTSTKTAAPPPSSPTPSRRRSKKPPLPRAATTGRRRGPTSPSVADVPSYMQPTKSRVRGSLLVAADKERRGSRVRKADIPKSKVRGPTMILTDVEACIQRAGTDEGKLAKIERMLEEAMAKLTTAKKEAIADGEEFF